MKNKIIITITVILIFVVVFFNRNSYIKSFLWKSNSLNKISDFIEFNDSGYNINGKNIVHDDKCYGAIIICVHNYLLVTNSEGDFCVYSNKGNIPN